MKMPNFSKMTVDALMSARSTIDQLLNKRLPSARKELEKQLSALNSLLVGNAKAAHVAPKLVGMAAAN